MHAWEKKTASHSIILAWRIPGTEEPGGLPSTGSHRVRHDWSNLAAAAVSWEPTVCISCQVNSHAGSLKLTRVGAFTPQKNSKHYKPALFFLERGLFGMYQHTMATDRRQLGTPHKRGEWRARTLCLSEGHTQILENKSLLCMPLIRLTHLHILHQSSNNNRYLSCTVVSIH